MTTATVDPANTSNQLALERSRMASERTLMAWIRTSLSLISFGFTIYKFFEYLRQSPAAREGWNISAPANIGRTMVLLGVVLLVPACIQHLQMVRRLRRSSNVRFPISLALIAAGVLSFIGLGAILNLFFRVGPF
jgi:putative membrane protein